MPTLVRLLTILGLAAAAVYAAMAALVVFVEPTTRTMTVEIPIPPRPEALAPPAPATPPDVEAMELGPFEAQATPPATRGDAASMALDPNVTGGTLRP